MSLLHFIDGKAVAPGNIGVMKRAGIFLLKPFVYTWRYRDLILTVLQRELYERFKGSVAGWVWAIMAPLLSLIVYTLAFSGVVTLPGGASFRSNYDYALFIFGGLITFNFFVEMAYRAPSLLHEYAHFIKLTMFPAEILPIVSTLRATVYAMIGFALMLLAQLVLTGTLHLTALLLPLWFVVFIAFLIGLTWTLAALGAFTRDASYFMMTVSPLMMFATPIFFSTDTFPRALQLVFYLNILTGFVEILRDIVVYGRLPNPLVCLWVFTLSTVAFWFGLWFFEKQRDGIADVL